MANPSKLDTGPIYTIWNTLVAVQLLKSNIRGKEFDKLLLGFIIISGSLVKCSSVMYVLVLIFIAI